MTTFLLKVLYPGRIREHQGPRYVSATVLCQLLPASGRRAVLNSEILLPGDDSNTKLGDAHVTLYMRVEIDV